MLVVETIAKIRRDYHVHDKGLRTIARERGLSRNTVRKIIRSGVTELSYEHGVQAYPSLGPFIAALEELLSANARRVLDRHPARPPGTGAGPKTTPLPMLPPTRRAQLDKRRALVTQ
jgi:hypothetical protein